MNRFGESEKANVRGRLPILWAALATAWFTGATHAALLQVERFEGGDTALHLRGGGEGWGTNLWQHPAGVFEATGDDASLAYPPGLGVLPGGGRLILQSGFALLSAERRMPVGIPLFVTNRSFYVSFLLRKTSVGGIITAGFADDAGNIRWRVLASATNLWVGAAGVTMGPGIRTGDTYFVVSRVIPHNVNSNQYSLIAYGPQDEPPALEPATWQIDRFEISNVTLTRFLLSATNAIAQIDEIRIGDRWQDVVPTAPTVQSISLTNGQIAVQFDSLVGFDYTLSSTENLSTFPVVWSPVMSNAGNGGVLLLLDAAPTSAMRMYRVLR